MGKEAARSPRWKTSTRPWRSEARDPGVARCSTWPSGLGTMMRRCTGARSRSSGRQTAACEQRVQRGSSSSGGGAVSLEIVSRVLATSASASASSPAVRLTSTRVRCCVKYTAYPATRCPISANAIPCKASCARMGRVTSAFLLTGVALYSTTVSAPPSPTSSVSHRPLTPSRSLRTSTPRSLAALDVPTSSVPPCSVTPTATCAVSVRSPMASSHARRGQNAWCTTRLIGTGSSSARTGAAFTRSPGRRSCGRSSCAGPARGRFRIPEFRNGPCLRLPAHAATPGPWEPRGR